MSTRSTIQDCMENAVDEYFEKMVIGKPWLNRDFRSLTVEEMEAKRVMMYPGTYCELFSSGSGMALWFLYHSIYENECYLIWCKYSIRYGKWVYGCRTDTNRLKYEEKIWI